STDQRHRSPPRATGRSRGCASRRSCCGVQLSDRIITPAAQSTVFRYIGKQAPAAAALVLAAATDRDTLTATSHGSADEQFGQIGVAETSWNSRFRNTSFRFETGADGLFSA